MSGDGQLAAGRSSLLSRLVPRVRAIAESPENLALQRALPLSFIGLGIGLAIFMALQPSGTLLARFSHSFAAAFGVMSALLVVLLSFDLAPRRGVPAALAVPVATVAFAASLPYAPGISFFTFAKTLGSSGLFLAIGIALLTVLVLRLAREAFGLRLGSVLGAGALVGIAVALALFGVSLTAGLNTLLKPLGSLGDSLYALLIITLVETLLWTIGIHGPALLAAIVLPIYTNLQTQNTDAMARGEALPHIVTVSIFLFIFPGGAGATFPLVLLLLRSRVKRVRTIALTTLLPSVANANEPLMFGLPLVLNPVLGVPFVVAPLVLAVVSYYAIALGFVARPAYYIPSTIPLPLGVFLATKDWRSILLIGLNIALALGIYAPFVAIYERHEREREAKENELAA